MKLKRIFMFNLKRNETPSLGYDFLYYQKRNVIRKTRGIYFLHWIALEEIYLESEVSMLILRHIFVMLLVLEGTGLQFLPIKISVNHKFLVSTGLEEWVLLAEIYRLKR